ncbi:MAG: hypothetical protein KDD45_10330 [Bdellovibrionales bacterium]|nr:hypothetical protein [Bdellovibrionales bacterium]
MAMFVLYLGSFCTCWFFFVGKREQIKRDVVERAIAKERALQAKQNL